jgi:hypothetical protein
VSSSKRRIALVSILTLALSLVATTPVLADEVAAHVNNSRADSLAVVAAADRVAGASVAAQAAARTVFHTDLSGLLGPCDSVGEIVGAGPNLPLVFSAFRQSDSHWSILSNPTWTAMGTGQTTGTDGRVYVSVVFCRQAGGAIPKPSPPSLQPSPTVTPFPSVGRKPAVLTGDLPALGARRGEIRARLDRQAESMLPDWYVGRCGPDDRDRVLEAGTSESGTCPLAS